MAAATRAAAGQQSSSTALKHRLYASVVQDTVFYCCVASPKSHCYRLGPPQACCCCCCCGQVHQCAEAWCMALIRLSPIVTNLKMWPPHASISCALVSSAGQERPKIAQLARRMHGFNAIALATAELSLQGDHIWVSRLPAAAIALRRCPPITAVRFKEVGLQCDVLQPSKIPDCC